MTKSLIVFLLIFAFTTTIVYGKTSHKLGLFSTINTQQHSSIGFGLQYQWQFHSSFAFETQYSNSGDIQVNTNSYTAIGDASLLSIGAVFLKAYNPELSLKFSSGANYIVHSSNNGFVNQASFSPYFKLALDYKITDHLSIEASQISNFQSDLLGNNYSFGFGINYIFTPTSFKKSVSKSPTLTPAIIEKPINMKIAPEKIVTIDINHSASKNNASWVIQLGAFTDELNADQALIAFKSNKSLQHYHVIFLNGYFRVVSSQYDNYSSAELDSNNIKLNFDIPNLIKQLK